MLLDRDGIHTLVTTLTYKQRLVKKENSSMRGENLIGLLFRKKKCFEVGFDGLQRDFLLGRKVSLLVSALSPVNHIGLHQG